MKKKLLLVFASVFMVSHSQAQTDKLWTSTEEQNVKLSRIAQNAALPSDYKLFKLDYAALKTALLTAPDRSAVASGVIISIPNAEGKVEHFRMHEASNFEPALQAQFPNIRSYVGIGIEDLHAQIRLSISPEGVSSMIFRTDKPTEFIEKYSADGKIYASYYSNRKKGMLPFTCSTDDQNLADGLSGKAKNVQKSSSGQYLTFRLAMSCTGEYAAYHGGTQAGALAAINATMTRVNGVFEKDFAIHMNLVSNLTILYTNAATDPYGVDDTNYNAELQSTLTAQVGEANYDVGHLVSAIGNNGNAGCIGCVCTDGSKGSGFTTSTVPETDFFDIDFVAHEIGHQFGANHSFSWSTENNSVNYEVGSGSTIMGYAGITSYDIQAHSDDHFHAGNIAQVQANMVGKTCPTVVAIVHSAPAVNAGADWTIPRSTPFILTGSATDAGGGALSYCWEQYDDAAAAQLQTSSPASPTKTLGPNWMSYSPSSSPSRYMPRLNSVIANQLTTQGEEILIEALSSVARTLNFRLTVRDNVANGGQTNFDNMVVTVSGTVGPFDVTSQGTTNQSWVQGATETITWTVNSTTTLPGSANVDILLSTDGGLTYPTVLLANTPNDGSANITVPNVTTMNARVMVKPTGHIYYDINSKPILIGYTATTTCNTYTNASTLGIPDGVGSNLPGATVSNSVSVPATGNLSDVNVTLVGTHTYFWDLVVFVSHPDGTQVRLLNRNCNQVSTGFNVLFNDASPAIVCAANLTGTFAPPQALSAFNNKPANGTWTLSANDNWGGDTGQINSWSVEVCTTSFTLANSEFEFENFSLYPNPNKGNFTVQFNSVSNNDVNIDVHDMRGRTILNKKYTNSGMFSQNIQLDQVQSGVYLVTVQDGEKKIVKRIVVE